ncbi:MAG: hypothetical protein H0Z32_01510 [Bacillaceae bacterium]|nr:hypothetical protein [Bacillaceae bacterium]
MRLSVERKAAEWFREELDIEGSASIRFFVRYGGVGGIQPGFSIGVRLDQPLDVMAQTSTDQLNFFIENDDAWYFEGYNLNVAFDENKQEPEYQYEKIQ